MPAHARRRRGLEGEDPDEVLRRCVDLLVGVAAVAIGAGRRRSAPREGLDQDGGPEE